MGAYPQFLFLDWRGSMESPCVNVCVIEADSGLCAGCGRSLDEIARWAGMTDTERRDIMQGLPDRLLQARSAAEK